MDYTVLYSFTLAMLIVLFVVLCIMENKTRITKCFAINRLYTCIVINTILDIVWVNITGKPDLVMVNRIVNIFDLTGLVMIGYAWMLTMFDSLPIRGSRIYRLRWIGAIPVVILGILYFVSAFRTGWFFYVTEDGIYQRGPFAFVATLITFIYLLIGAYTAGKCKRSARFSHQRNKYLVLQIFPIPVYFMAIIQSFFPVGVPSMQFGAFAGLLLLYSTNQNTRITRDYLTKLANRYAFEIVLQKKIDKYNDELRRGRESSSKIYVLEGDLNGFKKINDTFGHAEGDAALIATAMVLDMVVPAAGGMAARTGGDEFMVVIEKSSEEQVHDLIKTIKDKLHEASFGREYEITMSIGMAWYESGKDFHDVITEADAKLYEAKKALKASR